MTTKICEECNKTIERLQKFVEFVTNNQNEQNRLEKLTSEDENLKIVENSIDKTKLKKRNKLIKKTHKSSDLYPDKKCPICGKDFTETRKIPLHIKRIHTKVKDFHCSKCEYSAFTKFDITRHFKNVHLPKTENLDQRVCPECGKVFRGNNSQLTLHIKKKHLKIKKFECDLCSFSSYGKYEMRSHLEHVHIPKEFKTNYPCPLCPSILSSSMGLKVHHQHKHSGKTPFECDQCKKSFSLKETLKTHIRNVHYQERKFACKLCPKKYGQSVRLRDHEHNVHGKKQVISCPNCEKIFHTNRNLQTHLIYHQEPKFECNICCKKFFLGSKLKEHLLKCKGKNV